VLTRTPLQHACPHTETYYDILPIGSYHFASERCACCNAFRGWVPRPTNRARRKLIAAQLSKLAVCERLSAWERRFVANVSKQQGKLSPRQSEVVNKLVTQYLEQPQ
jgi:hypothetical protein